MIVREIKRIAVNRFLAERQQPAVVLERLDTDGDTYVRTGDGRGAWAVARSRHVRVPVLAYRTAGRQTSLLLAVGVELGLRVAGELLVLGRGLPRELSLVLGDECHDLHPDDDAYRAYVGIALHY